MKVIKSDNETKVIRLWNPSQGSVEGLRCVELKYEEYTFQIPLTLFCWLSSWVDHGIRTDGFMSPLEAKKDLLKTFGFLSSLILYDAHPLTQEQIEFYSNTMRRYCGRPKLEIEEENL